MKGKLKYAVPVSTNETLLIGSVVDIIGSSETEYLCKSIDGKEFPVSKFALHIIDHTPIIDWEQRRYEIAMVVAGGISTSIRPWEPTDPKNRADACIEFTDEIIKKLKGE